MSSYTECGVASFVQFTAVVGIIRDAEWRTGEKAVQDGSPVRRGPRADKRSAKRDRLPVQGVLKIFSRRRPKSIGLGRYTLEGRADDSNERGGTLPEGEDGHFYMEPTGIHCHGIFGQVRAIQNLGLRIAVIPDCKHREATTRRVPVPGTTTSRCASRGRNPEVFQQEVCPFRAEVRQEVGRFLQPIPRDSPPRLRGSDPDSQGRHGIWRTGSPKKRTSGRGLPLDGRTGAKGFKIEDVYRFNIRCILELIEKPGKRLESLLQYIEELGVLSDFVKNITKSYENIISLSSTSISPSENNTVTQLCSLEETKDTDSCRDEDDSCQDGDGTSQISFWTDNSMALQSQNRTDKDVSPKIIISMLNKAIKKTASQMSKGFNVPSLKNSRKIKLQKIILLHNLKVVRSSRPHFGRQIVCCRLCSWIVNNHTNWSLLSSATNLNDINSDCLISRSDQSSSCDDES
ncbi:uncharacterized protein CEXT_550191 [Caerostris extrusa]|uniref:Uncharacterized protein n=1 Tax=Caerostris extrusa TaxID=172846 RepID=A0AAV4XJA4_CAEEX|nr:uncharacterized protein CEXT_550191 [Caerostris extrusa]